MPEHQLFRGLVKAGGLFLLVQGLYRCSLWGFNHLIYQGYQPFKWLGPEMAALIVGTVLLLGSGSITRFAYRHDSELLSFQSIFRVGVKMFGLWLIFKQINLLFSLGDYLMMARKTPQAAPPLGSGYWAIQIVIILAAVTVGVICIRFQSGRSD